MKLSETSILQLFITEYETTVGPEVEPWQPQHVFQAVTAATADFLSKVKKKNQKVCLSFVDAANNFIMAAIVKYNKNDDEEGQDNWNYYYTFNEEDIKDVPADNKYTSDDSYFHADVTTRLLEHMLRVNEAAWIAPMISLSARLISTFLDQNAKPGVEVTLEEEGYFVASVTVEDDQPVKALLPDDMMKTIIKSDDATQKAQKAA